MKSTALTTRIILFCLCALFASSTMAASQSDKAKEKRWEEQIVDSLLVGDSTKLIANGATFLALYAEPTTDVTKGAVIILHGIGVHPAWPDVIDPLRMQLPDRGWHTLSLQMPILHNEAKDEDYPTVFPEAKSRIQAGVDFLKARGIKNIVLSGHSLGATMASYYMASNPDKSVKTFAMISISPGVENVPMIDSVENFKKINNVNIIDIYGSEDLPHIIKTLKKRTQIVKQMDKGRYQIHKVNGANHFYRNRQDELVKALDMQLSTTAISYK